MIVVSNTSPIINLASVEKLELLGILIESKQRGIVQKLDPILNDLISKAGFWMSQNLIQRVLEAAGE